MLYRAAKERLNSSEKITYGALTKEELLFLNARAIVNDEQFNLYFPCKPSPFIGFLDLKIEIFANRICKENEINELKELENPNLSENTYMLFRGDIYHIGKIKK